MRYFEYYASPVGTLSIGCDDLGLTELRFVDRRAEALGNDPPHPLLVEARRWLDVYFSGHAPDFTPPLHPAGSDFRRTVGRIMLEIPFGGTVTYGDIARRIVRERGGGRMSAQAVGGAVGSNPIAIVIPCHRVVGAHGNLTGYGGGMERKIALLQLEGVDLSRFFVPKKR